jgi:hypothetical protein
VLHIFHLSNDAKRTWRRIAAPCSGSTVPSWADAVLLTAPFGGSSLVICWVHADAMILECFTPVVDEVTGTKSLTNDGREVRLWKLRRINKQCLGLQTVSNDRRVREHVQVKLTCGVKMEVASVSYYCLPQQRLALSLDDQLWQHNLSDVAGRA